MNAISLVIILTFTGFLFFVSTQNILLILSEKTIKTDVEKRVEIFFDILKTINNIPSEYFLTEYFLGLSNITIRGNTIEVSIDNKRFFYFFPFEILEREIIDGYKYCIMKENNTIKILDCREISDYKANLCEPIECKTSSYDCLGPNAICIGDGFCNTFIGENCVNSIDCRSIDEVCCPYDPSSNLSGLTRRKNLKEGEECYCDNQCSIGLRCNNVDENFKNYKSGKACCPEDKKWNGSACVEKKAKITIIFIPTNFIDLSSFEKIAREHFQFFVNAYPIRKCPEKVEVIYESRINCNFDMKCDCSDLYKIEECALQTGKKFNYVIGITDQNFCNEVAGFTCIGYRTVFVEGRYSLVTAHELGHLFGLNDEYIDACRCGYGLINRDANCLKSDIGGSDAVPPYDSSYCSEKGTKCPSEYDITCYGNKNDEGGRDIMSFVNAPGPRSFARESQRWLSQLDIFKCD